MIKNYLKIAFRHLWHSRLYSGINIVGLATGITCMLLAVMYWHDERNFDSFHQNSANIYRVTTTMVEQKGADAVTLGGTGQVQGRAFKDAVPEVKDFVRILGGDIYSDVVADTKSLHLQSLFVDNNFFDVFTFHLLRGSAKAALKDINTVVVTESTAKKFFNSSEVVGKILHIEADPSFERLGKPMIISAVVEDPPQNSSLQFDILFTFDFMRLSFEDTNWLNAYLGTFLTLQPNADIHLVEQKFNKVFAFHAQEQLTENIKNYGYNPEIRYGLQRMTDIHLNPYMRINGNAEGGIVNVSNPIYSYVFMGIALFILLMATINFINISIANSLKRAKEVGVRKIVGGSKNQIIMQFLYESAILCVVAFILSLVFLDASLPLFNRVTGKQLLFNEIFQLYLLLYFTLVLTAVILLSGSYPAYILSKFKPTETLYNKHKLNVNHLMGRGLVVFQFALAIFLLISTIVYYGQMNYILQKDLGYNPNQIIRTSIQGDRDYKKVIGFLKNEFAKEPSIKLVSFGNDGNIDRATANNKHFDALHKLIDENYLSTLEIPLLKGRNFSPIFLTDKTDGVIVNEAFVKESGDVNPIGTSIKINESDDSKKKTIIGIVKDFHFGSLREPIKPMVMVMNDVPDGGIWLKFEKSKQKEAIAAVERIYKESMPKAIFQYNFLDELNAKQYLQEQRWQQVVSVATLLAFMICCLGLFGLAHLATHQRIKEIGIRKVLGAGVIDIAALLSKDFLKLVGIAFIIASPIAYFLVNKWLQNFAYRIPISVWTFALAGIIALLIALLTVSFQAIKAAVANPVKSLRTE